MGAEKTMNDKKKPTEEETFERTVVTSVEKVTVPKDERAYILFISGPLIGKMFLLGERETVIGRAAGSSSLAKVCQRLASKERIRSRSSGSAARRPAAVLMRMGKKTMRAEMMILEVMPAPNQMTSNGAMATVGTDWEATM